MHHAHTASLYEAPRSRACTQFVTWLRELGECRLGGLVSDEDFGFQRAEKLDELLQPPRFLWLAPVLGALIAAAVGASAVWQCIRDWRFTAGIGLLAGCWGPMSLGRLLREKFIEIQLRERLRILVALLEEDLITASELADYEDRLATGHPDVL